MGTKGNSARSVLRASHGGTDQRVVGPISSPAFCTKPTWNVRETDVNAEMRQTLEQRPTLFWYFNNGISRSLLEVPIGQWPAGRATDSSTFHCEDVTIVNGAQTVSTIGKSGEANPDNLNDVDVPIRIIVKGEDLSFADDVTKTNNRQNRIENRDFVTLDPEQSRIRTELAIDGIDYQLMRADSVIRSSLRSTLSRRPLHLPAHQAQCGYLYS